MTKASGVSEPDYDAEMRLPNGVTCADCRNGKLCDGLFGAVRRGFTSCDFWPSRYIAKTATGGSCVS